MAETHDRDQPRRTPTTPDEPQVVRTTIVGGRPPGAGRGLADIPRGIEVLVKKASIDPEFKSLLLASRSAAAESIGLELTPAEVMILDAAAAAQLEAIIAATKVDDGSRRAFLGKAAAAMLAALGVSTAGCGMPAPTGARPDPPPPAPKGIRPDPPPTRGTRPDPPPTEGIRPDRPPPPNADR